MRLTYLFSSHQAKASCESSALAPCESEGTDKGVDRIGIVVVGGIDGACAESPRLAVEPEPLLETNVQVEIVGEAELAWRADELLLFIHVIERETRPVFHPISQEQAPKRNRGPPPGDEAIWGIPQERSRGLGNKIGTCERVIQGLVAAGAGADIIPIYLGLVFKDPASPNLTGTIAVAPMALKQKHPSHGTGLDVFISESIAFHTAQESNAREGTGPQLLFPLDTACVEARLLKAARGNKNRVVKAPKDVVPVWS